MTDSKLDYTWNAAALTDDSLQILQKALRAAMGRVQQVSNRIADLPFADDDQKIAAYNAFADCGDALLKGQTPSLPIAVPAALGASSSPNPSATSDPDKDALIARIKAYENGFDLLAKEFKVNVLSDKDGTYDAVGLTKSIKDAVDNLVAAAAKPATPTTPTPAAPAATPAPAAAAPAAPAKRVHKFGRKSPK